MDKILGGLEILFIIYAKLTNNGLSKWIVFLETTSYKEPTQPTER